MDLVLRSAEGNPILSAEGHEILVIYLGGVLMMMGVGQ